MIGFAHPAIAVAGQLALFGLFGNWWLGPVAALFFVGREIAQAEYRWIEAYGHGLRANMPWWGRFDPRIWSLHSLTDMALPVLLTASIAVISGVLS